MILNYLHKKKAMNLNFSFRIIKGRKYNAILRLSVAAFVMIEILANINTVYVLEAWECSSEVSILGS